MQNTSPVRRSATALLGDFAKVFLSSIILDDATPGDRRQTGFARKSRLIKDFRPGTVFLKLWQELEPLCRIVDIAPFFGVWIVPIEELKFDLRLRKRLSRVLLFGSYLLRN